MKSETFAIVVTASLLLMPYQGLEASSQEEPTPITAQEVDSVPEHSLHYLEIVTPDSEAVRDFYSQAYDLQFSDATPELGNAFFATMPNGSLFGIRAPLRPSEEPIVRTYIRVSDIHRSTRRAEDLGATIALEPTEISGRGQIAIYLLGGIEQGIWQVP